MTPHQFAKQECANLDTHGACLALPSGRVCVLAEKPPLRCVYFEEVVLLLAALRPARNARLQEDRLRAQELYAQIPGGPHDS